MWDLGETRGTVAVRMPDDEVALAVLERTGPLAVSSANLTGRPAATDADAGRGDARRRRRGHRRRRHVPGRRGLHDHRRHRARGPGAAPRRAVARAAQRGDRGARGRARQTRARPDAGVPPRLPGRPVGDLPARRSSRGRSRCARAPSPRSATATCTPSRSPTSAGWPCSAVSYAAYLVARQLPFLSTQRGVRLPRRRGRAPGRGPRLRRRRARRHLRARRAHQARRAGARRRPAGRAWACGSTTSRAPTARQFSLDDAQGAAAHPRRGHRHDERGQLRRRPRRAGRGRGRHRGRRRSSSTATSLSAQTNLTLATTGALLSAALAGACAGFLPHNFHPARLFMGDSGSMLIGLVLVGERADADRAVRRHAGARPATACFVTVLPVLLPISLLMVPFVDLVLAVVRRTRAGRSPISADKQHLHHRLLEIGHSQRRAVLIMWMWAVTDRLRRGAGEPVRRAAGRGGASARCSSLTVALTFVLPKLHRPRKTGLGDTGLPENAVSRGGRGRTDEPVPALISAPGDFVIVFTSRDAPTVRDQTGRRHDDRDRASTRRSGLVPGVRGRRSSSRADGARGGRPGGCRRRGARAARRLLRRRRRRPGASSWCPSARCPSHVVASAMPTASLLVALLTYLLQLADRRCWSSLAIDPSATSSRATRRAAGWPRRHGARPRSCGWPRTSC